MTVPDLLVEGLRLMVIGMGIVFSFLLLLVGVLRLMSAAVVRLSPDASRLPVDASADEGEVTDAGVIAVISAAVARYRRDRQALP